LELYCFFHHTDYLGANHTHFCCAFKLLNYTIDITALDNQLNAQERHTPPILWELLDPDAHQSDYKSDGSLP
jgi:hypothetical protein